MKDFYVGLLRPLPERWREQSPFVVTSMEKVPPRALFVRKVRANDRAHAYFEAGKIVGNNNGTAERAVARRTGRKIGAAA